MRVWLLVAVLLVGLPASAWAEGAGVLWIRRATRPASRLATDWLVEDDFPTYDACRWALMDVREVFYRHVKKQGDRNSIWDSGNTVELILGDERGIAILQHTCLPGTVRPQ